MGCKILYCEKCDVFTLKRKCFCNSFANSVAPLKFSLDDFKAKYRRIAKKSVY